jgi:hypothetical protein
MYTHTDVYRIALHLADIRACTISRSPILPSFKNPVHTRMYAYKILTLRSLVRLAAAAKPHLNMHAYVQMYINTKNEQEYIHNVRMHALHVRMHTCMHT